jgi:hypothetical protein
MKTTLEFDLPKENREFNAAKNALGWQVVIFEFKQQLKEKGLNEEIDAIDRLIALNGLSFELLDYSSLGL